MIELSTEIWVGLIAFVIGLVLLFGAMFRKQAGFKGNPMVYGVIGATLAIFGLFTGVMPLAPVVEEETGAQTIIIDNTLPDVTTATFELNMVNGTMPTGNITGTVNSDGDTITYQMFYDSGNNEFGSSSGKTRGSANWTVRPVAPAGAETTQLVTLYMSFDEDFKYEGESAFHETNGEKDCTWRINGIRTDETTESASHTMLLTDDDFVELRWQFDSGNDTIGDKFATVGESFSQYVTFTNSDEWSETYELQWIIIGTSA